MTDNQQLKRIADALEVNLSPDPATIDFGAGHADHVLTAVEKKTDFLIVTNADAAAKIIAPPENRKYTVSNSAGKAITVKAAGQTGIVIADGKVAQVRYNGTDYQRVTADATITT